MEKYISKDTVVAEIDDWRDKIKKGIFSIPLSGREKADATFEYELLGKVISFLNTLEVKEIQEEPVNEELEEASKYYALNNTPWDDCVNEIQESFKAGAKWQKANLWKSADGDDLPDIDREVIALLDNGKVVYAHRPPEYWDGKDIATGKVTRNYPKTYDKGGWNIPNVKWWLDCLMPKEIEL